MYCSYPSVEALRICSSASASSCCLPIRAKGRSFIGILSWFCILELVRDTVFLRVVSARALSLLPCDSITTLSFIPSELLLLPWLHLLLSLLQTHFRNSLLGTITQNTAFILRRNTGAHSFPIDVNQLAYIFWSARPPLLWVLGCFSIGIIFLSTAWLRSGALPLWLQPIRCRNRGLLIGRNFTVLIIIIIIILADTFSGENAHEVGHKRIARIPLFHQYWHLSVIFVEAVA